MFVPSSKRRTHMNKLRDMEEKLSDETNWKVKIQECSGQPLVNILAPKIPISLGCPDPERCIMCPEGVKMDFSRKNVVYKATCEVCKLNRVNNNIRLSLRTDTVNPIELDELSQNHINPI